MPSFDGQLDCQTEKSPPDIEQKPPGSGPTAESTPPNEKALKSTHDEEKIGVGDGQITIKLDRRRRIALSIVLALAVFLIALDETIITTAIPKIIDRFHSLSDVGWYGSAYLLTMCCFQLHYGKLYTLFSTKAIFLVSLLIFELGSLICATRPSSPVLIIGRAISGVGACGIMSGVLIIISKMVPLRDWAFYSANIGSVRVVAGIMGPLGASDWRSYNRQSSDMERVCHIFSHWLLPLKFRTRCFYINLPLGGIVLAVFLFVYRLPAEDKRCSSSMLQLLKTLDIGGLLCFVVAIVCLLIALQLGGSKLPWDHPVINTLFALFGTFILVFMAIQIKLKASATLPPRIATQRTVIFTSVFVIAIEGVYFAIAYFISHNLLPPIETDHSLMESSPYFSKPYSVCLRPSPAYTLFLR